MCSLPKNNSNEKASPRSAILAREEIRDGCIMRGINFRDSIIASSAIRMRCMQSLHPSQSVSTKIMSFAATLIHIITLRSMRRLFRPELLFSNGSLARAQLKWNSSVNNSFVDGGTPFKRPLQCHRVDPVPSPTCCAASSPSHSLPSVVVPSPITSYGRSVARDDATRGAAPSLPPSSPRRHGGMILNGVEEAQPTPTKDAL